MTIERNVGMALELAGKTHAEIGARAAEMIKLVGLTPDVAARYPWQLIGRPAPACRPRPGALAIRP